MQAFLACDKNPLETILQFFFFKLKVIWTTMEIMGTYVFHLEDV